MEGRIKKNCLTSLLARQSSPREAGNKNQLTLQNRACYMTTAGAGSNRVVMTDFSPGLNMSHLVHFLKFHFDYGFRLTGLRLSAQANGLKNP